MKRKHSILAGLLLLTISSFGQDYIELAKQAWANKKYYDVIDYANKSLNVSSSGSAYWYRGIARYELQNYSEALPDFKSAIVYYSDYSSLGKLYYWAAYCKYVLKDYKGAISDFESSKNYGYEDKTNLYWYLGSANRNIAEYQKAAEAYTTAIGYTVDNSTLSNLYQLRGDARYELFKNNDAISDYIKAIEYNSNNSNAFWARAIARAANFQYDLAIGDFTSAINIIERENKAGRENDLSILYSNRGLYQYYLVKYDEAKADLQKSLDLNPNYDKANRNMGDVLYALKKYKEANPYYLRAVSLVKDDADRASCYSSLYWSCRYMLDYTQALTYLNSAIKINPNIHNYYRNRAYLQAVKKNYSASLDDYNKAIELYSKDTSSLISLYSDRAQLKIKMKNKNEK